MTETPGQPPRNEQELVELLRSVDVRAPESLHARVREMAAEREHEHTTVRGAMSGMRLRFGALIAAGAAAGAALALALGGAGGTALSLGEAASVTLRPATLPAPSESHSDRAQLSAAVDGVSFPYWEDRFGWRSTGSREGSVGGRRVRTVFYSDGQGRRVGYSIVAGTPAPSITLPPGEVRWVNGTPYHLSSVGQTNVVTWKRNGRLCVVAGRGVSPRKLLTLASWDDVAT
jgi:hypothetical protein